MELSPLLVFRDRASLQTLFFVDVIVTEITTFARNPFIFRLLKAVCGLSASSQPAGNDY